MSDRTALIGGPYKAPRCTIGKPLYCFRLGDLVVAGLTDAPVPWPYSMRSDKRSLVLTGDLARAVRTESVAAICFHWGVSRAAVRRWRYALRVPRFTEGTRALYRSLMPGKIPYASLAQGGRSAARKRTFRPAREDA